MIDTVNETAAIEETTLHTSAIPEGELKLIAIDELHESDWNPRQYYPEAAMVELIESMRSSGFREWLPLMVRPRPESAWKAIGEPAGYEIGAGHRRSRAARAAGITMVPCVVRPMTDEQFLDVLNFDNTGREDVHPLHEASGWRLWMERTGKGVLDIAARIGQSKEYVYQRLKYASLVEPAQQAFMDGKITAAHAILIARLEPKAQEKALKFSMAADWRGNMPSVRALADHLHQDAYTDLAGCAFDRSDRSLLSGAGDCDGCPKRAANIPGFEFEQDAKDADLCTDRTCYQQKLDNHLFRIRADLQAQGEVVLAISENWTSRKKGVYNKPDYDRVSANDKSARTALIVEGPQTGQVVTIRLKQPAATTSEPKGETLADKKLQREREEASKAREAREKAIRGAVLNGVLANVKWPLQREEWAVIVTELCKGDVDSAILAGRGLPVNPSRYDNFRLEQITPVVKKMGDRELAQLLLAILLSAEVDCGTPCSDITLDVAAKRYKVDAAKIRSEMEKAAKEAEGGTRREVIGKLPALNKVESKAAAAKKAAPAKKTAVPAKKVAPKKPAKKAGKK
jgi:ParB/RepB/Spo0J family partition protein